MEIVKCLPIEQNTFDNTYSRLIESVQGDFILKAITTREKQLYKTTMTKRKILNNFKNKDDGYI